MSDITHCPDCKKMLVGESTSFCTFCLESFKKVDIRFFSTKKLKDTRTDHSPINF